MSSVTSFFSTSKEKWFEKFARFGLISKGVVYVLMGSLSVLAAFGLSQQSGDKAGAFKLIYEQPFGRVILTVIALGLFGYVMLRFFQAFMNTKHKSKDFKGALSRIGYGLSGLVYLGLGAYAIRLALAGATGGGGDSRQFIVSKVFQYPGGEYIVGAAALIGIGVGIHQMARGVTGKFMKHVNLYKSDMKDTFKTTGTIGYISRGLVLGIIGYFLLHAALVSNPSEAQGTGAAFDFLQNKFGSVMMAIVAVGLAGYGLFCFVKAKYQRIDMDI